MKLKYALLFFCALLPHEAFSCSCLVLPIEDVEAVQFKIERSEAIFVGFVASITGKDKHSEIVEFEVTKPFKGSISKTITMKPDSGCPSPLIKKGKTLLIYADFVKADLIDSPPTCWELDSEDPGYSKELEILSKLLNENT